MCEIQLLKTNMEMVNQQLFMIELVVYEDGLFMIEHDWTMDHRGYMIELMVYELESSMDIYGW